MGNGGVDVKKEASKATTLPAVKKSSEEVRAIMKRCDNGDAGALAELRNKLKERPELAKLYDIAANTERIWIDTMFAKAEAAKECAKAQLSQLRRELAGENPSPLESILVDRIALCWLQVQYADSVYAQSMGELTLRQGAYHQDRQDRAHMRFLLAVRTLAQIRKLGVPVVQLNIADKQINMVSGAMSDDRRKEPENLLEE